MTPFRLANLELPPSGIVVGSGDMRSDRLEWIQSAERWSAIFYHHSNAVGVDAHTFAVQPGDVVMVPPGSRGSHARVEDDTHHWVITFILPGTAGDLSAIPLHVENMERFMPDLERAAARILLDARPLRAFAWNLMWAVARDKSVARVREELYAAEAFILKHLADPLSVPEIAEAAGKSQRQLLRAFREEHGSTIQEFIRRKRVREATRLLSTTSVPVKEVGQRVGVADLQAFNKLIREETGLSPRAFREKSFAERDV